jgi:hypothetical protein
MPGAVRSEARCPRGPDLTYEFLATELRTIQHYGVEIGSRKYSGPALNGCRNMTSPCPDTNGLWPSQVDPRNTGPDLVSVLGRFGARCLSGRGCDRRW